MAFERPKVIKTPIGNGAWGYPTRGASRRIEPTQLAIIHITGNKNTASMRPFRKGTRAEIAYMNRRGSTGPTAHTYISRDGAVFRCLKPRKYAAWSNGDLILPDRSQPYVREMIQKAARGFNPNELVYREYECTGHPFSHPLTKEQRESLAWQIARDSIATGLPIKPFVTVGIHAHINTRDRWNDPVKARRQRFIRDICSRAREWKRHMLDTPEPPDEEDPEPTDPPEPTPPDEEPTLEDRIAALEGELAGAEERIEEMRQGFLRIGRVVDRFDDEEPDEDDPTARMETEP